MEKNKKQGKDNIQAADFQGLNEIRGQGLGQKTDRVGGTSGGLLNLPEIQTTNPKIQQNSSTNKKKDFDPRKDPGYDYVSLGSRIQDQMKNYNSQRDKPSRFKNSSQQPPASRGSQRGQLVNMTPTNIFNSSGAANFIALANQSQSSSQTPHGTQFDLDYNTQPQPSKQSYGILALNNTMMITQPNHSLAIQAQNLGQLTQTNKMRQTTTFKDNELAIMEESRDDSYSQQQVDLLRKETTKHFEKRSGADMIISSKKQAAIKGAHPYQVALIDKSQQQQYEPKATEQVAYLLREAQKKEKIFIPLEKSTDVSSGYMYKEMKHPPENHAGIVVFSKQGFVTVGKERNATSDFISNEEFIHNGVNRYILKDIPFFKKFQSMRIFKQWKYIMRWNVYQRKRQRLAENFFFAKPIFSEKYSKLISNINEVRTLPFMEIKPNVIYGKKQQSMLDDRCKQKLHSSKESLESLLKNIKDQLLKLKKEIQDDDSRFENAVKEMRVQDLIKQKRHGEDLVMFSKARKQRELEEEQYRVQKIRQQMYDKFVEMVLRFTSGNLVELLYENKLQFKNTFKDLRNGPQFEVSVCFNNKGKLDTDPSMEDHHVSFLLIFENMEKAVYQNQNLIEFVTDIVAFLFKERKIYYKTQFQQMEDILKLNPQHNQNHVLIFESLKKDIERTREYLEQFIPLQEIYDFSKDWESNKKDQQISTEMSFYKETWLLMDRYNLMIDKIPPGNTKLGTILVETLSLKKYLSELPKRVIDSIRHNVTLTMETETKSLREELSKTSEILDQLPTSLNVYVEQVNTLKYVKEKQEDFSQKFQTINKLHQLCKQDNIKVNLTLQLAIDEVSHLYESLPKLQKTAAEGLNQNKDTMEKIMQSSSLVLSKKIKAFEKKYVETYLQDKTRLEDCADTLEELFKRSSKQIIFCYITLEAIHEIRSKVILYNEFLKLLYEDDHDAEEKLKKNKLQCSDDYEFVQSIHKETIKLWKMLLYWKKRRQMSYNTPFLQLDTSKIIRSINKINRYFEEKLSKNDFLRDKSRPLCKVVILQVKETSLIIEFLKDLRKESLQQRHWLQIFNLIKAPHLKNSSNFTIINLREYHIQNYREEIAVIIDHANTELKYEKIFKSIKEEWEQLELKIIPYKETMDSYILINTDTLSNAIEENLTTLETIGQSQYAMHVKSDIQDWIKTLKGMLKNLEIWVEAQKYWINLDPIFQSAQLEEILGNDTQEFQEYRNQFKRIMWSAFKNPKATYNLMITNRIEVFENLIKYFSVLQKKVHDYLEQRRLAFPRFFFLSDSQFLDFLTLANSNQDFNEYVNILFQGAHKLYINQVLSVKKDSRPEEDYLSNTLNLMEGSPPENQQQQNQYQNNSANFLFNLNSQKPQQEPITPYLRNAAKNPMQTDENKTIDIDSLTHDNQSVQDESQSEISLTNKKQNQKMMNQSISSIQDQGARLGKIPQQDNEMNFQVLGMISQNKELFLFDQGVSMKQGVEKWLIKVEEAMQETVAKMINYAVSSFPKQSLDEWILDYPQQVILTTIHLILSHEINDLLEDLSEDSKRHNGGDLSDNPHNDDDDIEERGDDILGDSENNLGHMDGTSGGQTGKQLRSKRSNLSSAGNKTFSKRSSKRNVTNNEEDEDQAMREYLKKKNELKAAQRAEEEEEQKKQQEEIRLKMEANEIPRNPEKEKRRFVDEMFGKDFPTTSKMLTDQAYLDKIEESKFAIKDPTKHVIQEKEPEFKDVLMTLLQKKTFQGLYLRLQFWINQIVKSLYTRNQVSNQHILELELHSVQKMIMKTIVSFLLFQRDIVDNLLKKNVRDQSDFEWQSQVRLLWTGIEPGCRVDCGGWSTYQQNEYLGSVSRLTITPLTNRYFIFMSAALREKSAVMFKCAPSESTAGYIFEEFANICSVPFRKFQCNPIVQMKMLMQYLNGAALANVWIFYEHLDKLPFIHFQTFNKEIQMVQQQFIIAELSQNEVGIDNDKTNQQKKGNIMNMFDKQQQNTTQNNQQPNKIASQLSYHQSQINASKNTQIHKSDLSATPFTKAGKICFGVFASISHSLLIDHTDLAADILAHSQSAFRVMALTRPNELQLFKILLKQDGFDYYDDLSTRAFEFIDIFYQQLQKAQNFSSVTQANELINCKDIKTIVKIACLLMEKDLQGYKNKQIEEKQNKQQREYLSLQKTKDQKIQDAKEQEEIAQANDQEKYKIEMNAMKESLRLNLYQKFINQWKDQILNKEFNEAQITLEQTLHELIKQVFSISDNISEQPQILSLTQQSLVDINNRRKSISSHDIPRRFTSNSGFSSLLHHNSHQSKDQQFLEAVTTTLKEVISKLNYAKVNPQLRNCISFIELLRRNRGIALVGPTCSGKTTTLKLVSNCLNLAFGIKMRTSVVNTSTYTSEELYGTIDAFNKNSSSSASSNAIVDNDQETKGAFNKGGIFSIILDVFEKERLSMGNDERQRLIQSIFFDSGSVDSTMSESLIEFLRVSNKRESQNSFKTEFLMDLTEGQAIGNKKVNSGEEETIPVVLPNGSSLMFPSDLYLFFETLTLKEASPAFVTRLGLVFTESDDLDWKTLCHRYKALFLKKHGQFFKSQHLNHALQHIDECMKEFLEPFLDKLLSQPKLITWQTFNPKSSILQFFNILNSVFYRFAEICKDKTEEDDAQLYLLQECERDVFWSSILLSTIWSFGAPLNKEMRKVFEEVFFNFKRKFNINIGGPGRQRFTLFDIYYDSENLQWDLLQEKLEYKLKLHYDSLNNQLLIPTTEVSQAYFMMDMILSSLKYDDSLDKHFRILGPSATSKSLTLSTFMKKYSDQYHQIIVPMSCYLTLNKLKKEVERHYLAKRRNQLEPQDKNKKIVLMIDDLHLQGNLKVNVLEFLRTWCVSKGYYDMDRGFFKNIGDFGTIMAENSEYRGPNYCKYEGKKGLDSRFLFYTNTLYVDEFDFDRYKIFVQHWLTSKMWNTSKLINKYYILMTNSIMALMDKLKRQEYFHNSSFLRLTNFHIFARFCANLANYTLISDDPKEITIKGLKEEDSAANMMVYEMVRSFGDRILNTNHRAAFIQRVLDSCKQEFVSGSHLSQPYIDQMLLGNYHQRRQGAHIKYLYMNNEMNQVRDEIRQKIRKSSNNHYLETFLDAPNGPKEIFRLSRILFKEMQHLILLGHAGSGKHEYLQLAAILNDALIFELNVAKFGEPLKFATYFKQTLLSVVSLNQFSLLIINDQQLRDPSYIDFAYNFMANLTKKESCILMDNEFKQSLIDIEKDLVIQNSQRRSLDQNNDILFLQALRKIQKNVHLVFLISDFNSYFEWVSLFPGLESKCEIVYIDELSTEGYKQLTSEFFLQRDTDIGILNDQKLAKALVETRQIVKHKILNTFYSQPMLQHTVNEEYMSTQAGEYVFNSDSKIHGFLYANGNFTVQDPMHKQINYNIPMEISTVYKTRYVMFLELFRFLYDFLSMNLIIRRNYYETFLRKASEFQDFFKDIKSTKSSLHNESNQITYKLVSLRDKINKIQQIINDKESNINRRQKDINDLEIELKNNRDELNSVIYEKDQMIDDILDHLEKINGSEFSYIITAQKFTPNEKNLLDILAIVIEKDQRVNGYSKNEFDMYFLNREELINLLNDRRNYDYDQPCFDKIKVFINQYTATDFKDKPLFRQMFNFLMELYRKLNVRNTMSNTFTRIKEIKEQIDSNYFSINYSKQFIEDKKEEMEGLKVKFERIQDQESSLSKRIEEAEISHMRTEHIFQQIERYTTKIYSKLTEIKKRIDNLLGDCIIMAASVSYLGIFSMKERFEARRQIYEYINNVCLIKCSPSWNETSLILNTQNKIFKQVIKEYGLGKIIQSHNFSGIMSQSLIVEALFTMIFAPACPYIVDPTGQLQEFMKDKIFSNLKIKQLYASDMNINSKLEQVLRSTQFIMLNDLNDFSKDTYGLSRQDALLTRLSTITHNGFDFDYERISKLKQLHTLGAFHNSYSSFNKRISTQTPEYENLSFYQIQIFSPRLEFTLNQEYASKATIFSAINTDSEIISGVSNQAPWIEIKLLMLKHFIPEQYEKLQQAKEKLKVIVNKQTDLNKNFENAFLVANQDTLQNINEYSLLKQAVEDIRLSTDEKRHYQKQIETMLNESTLLSSYSNVLTLFYLSLKKLSKISGEITYSWKMYLAIIDQTLFKIVRDLNSNMYQTKSQHQNEQSNSSITISLHGHQSQKEISKVDNPKIQQPIQATQKEFTIDEQFVSTIIVPSIYGTIISGIKQHLVPLYNLILSVKISYKKQEISENELEFFFKQLFSLKDFYKWRMTEHDFIDLDNKIEKTKFYAFKREVLKVYPEQGRKLMEYIEKELGQSFTYKAASLNIYGKIFNQHPEFKNFTLMQKINIGFLCPDHEFKSKICQLVYEQLSSIFTFSEEYIKLHHFIKQASWQYPISLFSQSQINIINTVCSIASYYGVGLEVVRTDQAEYGGYHTEKSNMNQELSQQIASNIIDYSKIDETNIRTYKDKISKEAATYEGQGDLGIDGCASKVNQDSVQLKDNLGIDDKLGNNQNGEKDPLKMIEQCALNGSWVFVSTLRFPSFWHKLCHLLEVLRKQNKIQNTFRIFFDLQGYKQNEIPDSFIFNHSISFYLTDLNNEDMEGFNDVWANILNDKILAELTNYDPKEKEQSNEESKQQRSSFKEKAQDIGHRFIEDNSLLNNLSPFTFPKESPKFKKEQIAIKQEDLIHDQKQRELYKDFLRNQKMEELKNASNTLIFGSQDSQELKPYLKQNSNNNKIASKSKLKDRHDFSPDDKSYVSNNFTTSPKSFRNSVFQDDPSNTTKTQNQLRGFQNEYQQQQEDQELKVSRINSMNNSVELSKGENQMIQELRGQFDCNDQTKERQKFEVKGSNTVSLRQAQNEQEEIKSQKSSIQSVKVMEVKDTVIKEDIDKRYTQEDASQSSQNKDKEKDLNNMYN